VLSSFPSDNGVLSFRLVVPPPPALAGAFYAASLFALLRARACAQRASSCRRKGRAGTWSGRWCGLAA